MKRHDTIVANGKGLAFAAGILLLSALPALSAPTPEQKCEAAKKSEAGKFAACRLKAESKLVSSGDTAKYDKALAKCAEKLTDNFEKLESAGACPTTGDAAAIASFLSECSDGVSDSAEGGGSLPSCGDAEINVAGEECDGGALGGRTCSSFGFTGGTLACGSGCTFDTSACTSDGGGGGDDECGNAEVDPGEDCDQADLNGGDCGLEGFAGGNLACGAGCVYDTSGCYSTRFVDNADGTVTDRATGLMWERKFQRNNAANAAELHDADNRYVWSGRCSVNTARCQFDAGTSAECFAQAGAGAYGCAECGAGEGVCQIVTGGVGATIWQWLAALNTAAFAGHSDWRIPTREELASLVDYSTFEPSIHPEFHGASCGAACTDLSNPACACTAEDFHWSTGQSAEDPSGAWGTDFYMGDTTSGGKTNPFMVRAVRDVD